MTETLDIVPNDELEDKDSPAEAVLSSNGLAIVLSSRVKTIEDKLTAEIIYIDHARENQLVIPHYASDRSMAKKVLH